MRVRRIPQIISFSKFSYRESSLPTEPKNGQTLPEKMPKTRERRGLTHVSAPSRQS
ncbi:hypothetical protein HOLleu_34733 [Holothuria leucospilota]|uniref:Uncharacterized protein n=1 Tax=Holothuria leucospilota TaxID=206669 RepID=A0A9Q0YNS6_HOLLE|nr:hypothetical protein HOLleu_34733 [Holothuria leucospilota]